MSMARKTNEFNADEIGKLLLKQLPVIFNNIDETMAIERYLLSWRSQVDFCSYYGFQGMNKTERAEVYKFLTDNMGQHTCPSIAECLKKLQKITKNVHLSFASKIMASLDRNLPVYDKWVNRHLGLNHPHGNFSDAETTYHLLVARMQMLLENKKVRKAIKKFDHRFPRFKLKKYLTDTKKLDIMLWQMRD